MYTQRGDARWAVWAARDGVRELRLAAVTKPDSSRDRPYPVILTYLVTTALPSCGGRPVSFLG
jgi:hypothetical protein